jgi:hypothetical protein
MWIERNLFVTCSSGLCNRLLMLAGCLRIARRTSRTLALYWPVNQDLGIPFNDLFENSIPLIDGSDLTEILDTTFTVKVYNAWKTQGPIFRKISPDGDPDSHIVIIKGWSYPMFADEGYSRALDVELRQDLLSLVPRAEIRAAVDRLGLPGDLLGVHIRRGDHIEEFGQSRDEYFITLMRTILGSRPDQKFLLCTDVAAIEAKFREMFGDALVTIPKQWPGRHRPEGAREGLIDLLALARTAAILGNVHSSFSQTAARLGDKRMIVVDENSAVHRGQETCATLLEAVRNTPVLAP